MKMMVEYNRVLLSRAAARDLYDFNNMISFGLFNESENGLFRKSIIFYNTILQETVNKFFDTSAIDGLKFPKIKRDLLPVLRNKDFLDLEMMKSKAKEYIAGLMWVTDREMQYMESF